MTAQNTILWYDLETFGLNPHYDRIAQFAAIRTDMDLNIIDRPLLLYCRTSDDYLPDPLAILVTGITPDEVNREGLCESEFIERINDEFSRPNTIVAGFNSIKFDDEFIRNALYRNFLDPYAREWQKGCSRFDIIDLIRMAYDLRPDGIKWPLKAKSGNPTFKLTELTKANNVEHEGAHDALVDVKATIGMARILKKAQPRLWDWALKLRKKSFVKDLLATPFGKPVLYTAASNTTEKGCTTVVCPITGDAANASSIICFDLTKDVMPLINANEIDIYFVDGITRIATNKVPMISPINVLNEEIARKLGLDMDVIWARYLELKKHPEIIFKVIHDTETNTYEQIKDPDFRIYADSFFSDSDKEKFDIIRRTDPKERLNLNMKFEDPRVPEMLWRHVCRNYPEVLDEQEKEKFRSFCASRILNPPAEGISLNFFERKINEKLDSFTIDPEDKVVLAELKDWGERLKERVIGKQN